MMSFHVVSFLPVDSVKSSFVSFEAAIVALLGTRILNCNKMAAHKACSPRFLMPCLRRTTTALLVMPFFLSSTIFIDKKEKRYDTMGVKMGPREGGAPILSRIDLRLCKMGVRIAEWGTEATIYRDLGYRKKN
jgi:hypothetical protein